MENHKRNDTDSPLGNDKQLKIKTIFLTSMGSGVSVTIMVGKTTTITMMLMVKTVVMKMMTMMIPVITGSLSNYDDDDDDNLKKQ